MSEADNPTIDEDRNMRYAWVPDLIRSVGVPTAILGALMWAMYQVAIWLGDHVALPIINQNIQTMQTIDQSQKEITSTLQALQKDLGRFPEKNHELLQHVVKDNLSRDEQQKKVIELLDKINNSIKSQER